jgi:hypothetical protein
MVEVVSAKVDDETRRRMRRLPDINWSEVIRQAILNKIEEEEARRSLVDRERLEKAAKETDALRARLEQHRRDQETTFLVET